MIGEINDEHVAKDISDAKALGLDAFAMNIDHLEEWATGTVDRLFTHADSLDFSLFFSFDHNYFTDPSVYTSYIKPYLTKPSYYKHNGKPFLSTFGGEAITDGQWASLKNSLGNILLVPGFFKATPSSTFFADKPNLDGIFNWNAWPTAAAGKVEVPTADDETYMTAAKAANKLFMLGMSPLQFKHMDDGNNWYVRGESNFEVRIEQALQLQPDMIELQTWNDGGESHYMGNLWDEPLTNSPEIHAYVDGYDHTGYQQILPAFIQAWKRGDTTTAGMVPTNDKPVQGAFWYHTLTVGADCSADPLGKPHDIENAEDAVSGVVLVAKGQTGLVAVVNNGDKELGKVELVEGYNRFKVEGLGAGKVQVEVWDGETMVGGGYGLEEVSTSAALCNYNFQVVGFPG
ncbi:glycoside hydrolase family 71 protein [Lentithecium fluviatile CBS 122367]|uniref:Glycoside hydrolase family 71 protein n=1 Tax=Lentithecium fluviatile CBS 122367 TaxID=1168545 RepID=A0A6G1IP69_9PLEO|nr:glycoside hydrolase family 71 protein [Lentithecium fluviatile CBS 122367]